GDDRSLYGRAGGDGARARGDAVSGREPADLLTPGKLLEGLTDISRAARLRHEGGGEQRGHECDGGAEGRAHVSLAATMPSPASEAPEWCPPPPRGIRGRGG